MWAHSNHLDLTWTATGNTSIATGIYACQNGKNPMSDFADKDHEQTKALAERLG